ncbi:serine hydrolase domain-containing protein [Actinocorallia sp. B10E7]|uniref:serine hydrolase domain-containing protein n=1 Tax=Actinocorallia sp. B10E7 TaxID=3153558 RepID=UPI00325D0324
MRTRWFSVIAAACGLGLLAGPAPATASVPSAATILQAGTAQGVTNGYPGVIGLVRDDGQAQYAHAGVGNRDNNTPADPQAKFRIGSNSKVFTAATILLLEADGVLSLDDTVAKWLPNAVTTNGYDGSKITIRQLLNHTSNIPNYTMNYDGYLPVGGWAPQNLVNGGLKKRPPNAEPGTKWEYSNTNYILAGMIIQAATGNTPAVEMKNRIFDPLGLSNTSLPTGVNMTGNHLRGYFYVGPVITNFTAMNVEAIWTAGAVISTLDDMATFTRALVGGTLLPPEQQAELKTTVPASSSTATYGLGLFKVQLSCGKVAWYHDGMVPGYVSFQATSDDGAQQVMSAANEAHLASGTNGQKNLQAAVLNAFCAV